MAITLPYGTGPGTLSPGRALDGKTQGQNQHTFSPPSGTLVGYVRCSTLEQSVNRQVTELEQASCTKIFRDEGVSGSRMGRPGLTAALDYLRSGDTLVVQELSRLGRDTAGVLTMIRGLEDRSIALRILSLGVQTDGALGHLVVSVLAAAAELERDLLRERVVSGIEEARRRGRIGGRPRVLSEEQRELVRRLTDEGRTVHQLCGLFGVSPRTVKRVRAAGNTGCGTESPTAAARESETR